MIGDRPKLDGAWEEPGVIGTRIEIRGRKLTMPDAKIRVRVLKPAGAGDGGPYIIADSDPSKYELYGFSRLEYRAGRLTTRMLVCDAPPHEIEFRKV